ncbi:hypothetical protein WOLCODRAFT_155176 [Wolfiporia cocos MD-104 SS10]|uniref:Uncharacterized protein n=1 Tax=Wolfiporia cocos (strain MD-104) TaxID=742152 RepID=A0A2H3J413_WOLCO|nr:hypothetical protein WOLCODRAFT_155176 [Wolfiporia cocos MD-104 SS10]
MLGYFLAHIYMFLIKNTQLGYLLVRLYLFLRKTRFGYTSWNIWDDNDGTFLGAEFYTYILNVFKKDADWAAEVYSKGTQTVTPNGIEIRKCEGPSLIERINKRLAEASEATSHPESDDLPIPLWRKSPLGLFESFNNDEDEEAVAAQVDGEEQVEAQVDGEQDKGVDELMEEDGEEEAGDDEAGDEDEGEDSEEDSEEDGKEEDD